MQDDTPVKPSENGGTAGCALRRNCASSAWWASTCATPATCCLTIRAGSTGWWTTSCRPRRWPRRKDSRFRRPTPSSARRTTPRKLGENPRRHGLRSSSSRPAVRAARACSSSMAVKTAIIVKPSGAALTGDELRHHVVQHPRRPVQPRRPARLRACRIPRAAGQGADGHQLSGRAGHPHRHAARLSGDGDAARRHPRVRRSGEPPPGSAGHRHRPRHRAAPSAPCITASR